jgi:putative heme-binding domain-containing protein
MRTTFYTVSVWLALAAAAVLGAGVSAKAAPQHETEADLQDGARVFRNSCANCHGPDGDQIAGIDLGRGVFRRELSDTDLVRIIRTGIPGTPMPATNMSEEQAGKVVAYLRSTAATKRSTSVAGDPARGKMLFDGKGGCLGCHRVGPTGSRLGPELTSIGRVRRAIDLERSLLEPAAEILPTGRFYRVVSKDGVTTTGRLLNLDTFTVQLMDQREQLRSFVKADLREHGWAPTPMPSYQGKLTTQEIADVISYLVSLKGRVTP